MNNELILVYETDANSGTPTLRVQRGKPPFDSAELHELEREVRSRYDRLARGAGGRLSLRSQRFEVEVERGLNPRQPKLILRLLPAASSGETGEQQIGWATGFFEELRQLLDGERDVPLPLHEKGSLATVLDELRSLNEVGGVALSAVLLAGYLATAEQHSRERDAARAGVYVLALRGLSRFLPEPEESSTIFRDGLPLNALAASGEYRQPTWLGRFFGWFIGSADQVPNPPL
jgi:hypothetical protein